MPLDYFEARCVENKCIEVQIKYLPNDNQKYFCETDDDCIKYNTCSEECVSRVWEENNSYTGPVCGPPWKYGCKCSENKCREDNLIN